MAKAVRQTISHPHHPEGTLLWLDGDWPEMWPALDANGGGIIFSTIEPPRPGDQVAIVLAPVGESGPRTIVRKLIVETPTDLLLEQYNPPRRETLARAAVAEFYRVMRTVDILT